MTEKAQFKVGDKVTMLSGMGYTPSHTTIIEKISPKRGDITIAKYPSAVFSQDGWQKGIRWGGMHFVAWIPEHDEIIKKKHMRFVIEDVNLKEISDEDTEKIYVILKPYYDKNKAEQEAKEISKRS